MDKTEMVIDIWEGLACKNLVNLSYYVTGMALLGT